MQHEKGAERECSGAPCPRWGKQGQGVRQGKLCESHIVMDPRPPHRVAGSREPSKGFEPQSAIRSIFGK